MEYNYKGRTIKGNCRKGYIIEGLSDPKFPAFHRWFSTLKSAKAFIDKYFTRKHATE